ncbi:hypothetical protein Tco_0406889 [Tanacetum coccineum]
MDVAPAVLAIRGDEIRKEKNKLQAVVRGNGKGKGKQACSPNQRSLHHLRKSIRLRTRSAISTMRKELKVTCYTDVGFETDKYGRKSHSRYVFVLNGRAIDWKSANQSTIAMSSTEAEYIAASEVAMEAVCVTPPEISTTQRNSNNGVLLQGTKHNVTENDLKRDV